MHVVVVKGRPYEMGYAYGKLMAVEIKENIKNFWKYMEQQGIDGLKKYVPGFLAWPIIKLGKALAFGLLELDYMFT